MTEPFFQYPRLAIDSTMNSVIENAVNGYSVPPNNTGEVVNYFRTPPWGVPRKGVTLVEPLTDVLDSVCAQAGLRARAQREDAMLRYGNVSRHRDLDYFLEGKAAWFLHVVLQGSGTLRFPGVRSVACNELLLEPGTVFRMNPRFYHEVVNAQPYSIVSLCAVVLPGKA